MSDEDELDKKNFVIYINVYIFHKERSLCDRVHMKKCVYFMRAAME